MGWDGIDCWYWCRHRSKACSKAHRLPSKAFRQFGRQGYSKKQAPPQSRVYRRVHTDWSDLLYYNIQISGGSCSSPQKKEVARVCRRRGSCSQPVKQKPGVKETRQGATLPKLVSVNLEWENMLMQWRRPKESLSNICPIRTWCFGKSRMPQVLHSQ